MKMRLNPQLEKVSPHLQRQLTQEHEGEQPTGVEWECAMRVLHAKLAGRAALWRAHPRLAQNMCTHAAWPFRGDGVAAAAGSNSAWAQLVCSSDGAFSPLAALSAGLCIMQQATCFRQPLMKQLADFLSCPPPCACVDAGRLRSRLRGLRGPRGCLPGHPPGSRRGLLHGTEDGGRQVNGTALRQAP
jgi:hypothetical protein